MTEEKEITWQDIYKTPFKFFIKGSVKVLTDEYKMAFDFIPEYWSEPSVQLSLADREKIVRIINGSNEKIISPKNLTHKNGVIYLDGVQMIWIRGWGYLTGIGGLNLDGEIASKIMNEFGDSILAKIQKACP